jgi:hypothetical protein
MAVKGWRGEERRILVLDQRLLVGLRRHQNMITSVSRRPGAS